MDQDQRLLLLNQAFSPAQPIITNELFRGRYKQIQETCEAINENGQHFVVYGERGVGKTSLSNVISTKLLNVFVIKVTCNRTEDFSKLWQKAFSKVTFNSRHQGIGFTPETRNHATQLDMFLPNKEDINSLDIQTVFERVTERLCFVFDEFDSITSKTTRDAFADTIKMLSDNAPFVSIGIVGISSSVDKLVGSHPSLERCLRQIKMPRMSKDELSQIVFKGLDLLELDIEKYVSDKIISFSSGFPHYAHLLTKYAAQQCISENKSSISDMHYKKAITSAIENTNQSIRSAYQQAISGQPKAAKANYEELVAACVVAETDEFGTFSLKDILHPYYLLTGKKLKTQNIMHNVNKLCEINRGEILVKQENSKPVRYLLRNPLMGVYVKMKLDMSGKYQQTSLSL